MSPLQMGLGSLVGAVVFGLVPLVVLLIVIYRLAQIAENTDRMADALEYMARTQRTTGAEPDRTTGQRRSPDDERRQGDEGRNPNDDRQRTDADEDA